jgi:hypothetical protein
LERKTVSGGKVMREKVKNINKGKGYGNGRNMARKF